MRVGGGGWEGEKLTTSGDGGCIGNRKKDGEEAKERSERCMVMHLNRLVTFFELLLRCYRIWKW